MSAFRGRFVRKKNIFGVIHPMLVYLWDDTKELGYIYRDDNGDWVLRYANGRIERFERHDEAKSQALKLTG